MSLLRMLGSIPFIPLPSEGVDAGHKYLNLPRLPDAPNTDRRSVLTMQGLLARRMRELLARRIHTP